ncbi:MAG: hypothetical protein J7L37_04610 [Thermococcus sp.]|nr:hypothetical protein [Thermococcus sp.]
MPKAKQIEKPKQAEVDKPEALVKEPESIEVPTLSSLIEESLASEPATEAPEEPEPEPIVDPAKLTLSYLSKKEREKAKLVKETLKVLPELAKAGDPFAALMLEKLVQGGSKSNDIEELKELAKAMSYTVILPEMVRDVMREVRGRGGGTDNMTLILLKQLEERDRRLQELIREIKEEKESKILDEMRKEFYENLSQVVQAFQQSLEELRSQIMAVTTNQGSQERSNDPLEMFDKLVEYEDRFREFLMKRGYRVVSPEELIEKYADAKELDVEKEIKLKELQLREKELEAKKSFYDQLGRAIAKLTENPDNIVRLVQGLIKVIKGGPTNEQWGSAVGLSGSMSKVNPLDVKPKVPSLEDLVVEAGEDG